MMTMLTCESCGNPDVVKGVTRIRIDRQAVTACEVCEPALLDEPQASQEDDVKTLRVRVIKRIWEKPDGSWYIYFVECDGPPPAWVPDGCRKPFSLVGPVGVFTLGDIISVFGKFVTDPKYGFQLQAATAAQLAITESETGLVSFLSRLPNIGRVRAEECLRKLGGLAGVLNALDEDPSKLTIVAGITPERADEIKTAYDEQAGFRDYRLFCANLGLTESIIAASIEEWGKSAQETITEDPFSLMELPRVSFKKADDVATKLGVDAKHPRRCAAGLENALRMTLDEGHTYIDEVDVLTPVAGFSGQAIRSLGFTADETEVALKELEKERERKTRTGGVRVIPQVIVRENGRVFLREVYQAELTIARELHRLLSAPTRSLPVPEVWGDIIPADEQLAAVELACAENVLVLTGGPGVGKSFTTNAILNAWDANGVSSVLAAPTGKAAIRMTELTGRPAKTIHSLLGHTSTSSDSFSIEVDAIVVDESSMCDAELTAKLLQALRTGARLLIVGDVDQLPSIGPGRVLFDLIESKLVPTVRLTKIFRQASDGDAKRIPEVARDINEGRLPDLGKRDTDVVYMPVDSPEEIQERLIWAVSQRVPEKYGYAPAQIQVLSPQKGEMGKANWPIGVKSLNFALQSTLNPKTESKDLHIGDGYTCRVGDRVMHVKNNYDLGIMNGEQAIVLRTSEAPFSVDEKVMTSRKALEARTPSLSKKKKSDVVLVADYGQDRLVGYTKEELRELHLAYACTVHKYQGSQQTAIVIPVHSSMNWMQTRQLLYTALTRATKYVLIIGQERAVAQAVRNTRGAERRTTLQERLATVTAESETP